MHCFDLYQALSGPGAPRYNILALRRRKISTLSPGAGSDAVVPLRMGFMRRDLGVDKLLIGRLDAG